MNHDIFSNGVGFSGNTQYSLKYMTRTRNFRYSWPHNNIFCGSKDEELLIRSVFKQPVGVDRSFSYAEQCSDLKLILLQLRRKHEKTNYKFLLRKSGCTRSDRTNLQAAPRCVLKEYVHRLIHNIIPLPLFGTEENRIIFERNVKKILGFGKSQVFSLTMLMRNVRTKNRAYLHSVNGNLDKTNLLAKLYLWLLRVYIFAAIKCVFYVTESNYSNQYLYYEKAVWQRIQQRSINRLKRKTMGLYKNCILSRTILTKDLFVLKIIPKRRGSRPLYVKWKRGKMRRNFISPVKVAKHLLQISEKHFRITYSSWRTFHNHWLMLFFHWMSLSKPPVYFVRADFIDAFGSILQTRLIDMISKMIEDNKSIREISFPYYDYKKRIPVTEAFNVVKKYITNFVFKNNKYVYKLDEGISQGGSLSSLLCNFYFGEVDLTYLSEFVDDKVGFLIRNCDDYLYVTLNQNSAIRFLNRLENGFPDFNLRLNGDKTETNLRDKSQYLVSFGSYQLDVKSFQLYGCYKSYHDTSIFYSSTFKTVASPGKIIMKRLMLLCTVKLDKSYFDSTYNSTYTILYNVFQAAVLVAARCFGYVRFLLNHCNQSFVFKCVKSCSSRIAATVLKKLSFNDDITSAMLQWIVFKAFLVRLQATRSEERFADVVCRLHSTLISLQHRCSRKQLEVIESIQHIRQPAALRSVV